VREIAWKTHPAIKRYEKNPILTHEMVPYEACLVFNAGIAKYQGKYVMIFRNDHGDMKSKTLSTGQEGLALGNQITLGVATSGDGREWTVENRVLATDPEDPLCGAYDPRLTVLDGRLYMCFATGCGYGTQGGVAVTDDLETWEVLNITAPDNRNMVIFPERINGMIARLERPFAGYLRGGNDPFDTWLSLSPEGRFWGETKVVLTTEKVDWVNNKVGPAAPPVKTDRGWLAFFHGVDTAEGRDWGWSGDWNKRYSAGLMLLDLEEPWKVIGLCPDPVLVPEAHIPYEAEGYRDYVIFPGGMILEDDGEVKIYYGAADTVEALATAQVDELLDLCQPVDFDYRWK
jgi:beta-1,4-mannooligosaccharide/beta-1,4-mannosyl-N-acetylglucosamine phosphorylase